MRTPEEFYANVGDTFGIIGPNRVNPHRGTDFPWGEGEPIPSWCDGIVAMSFWTPIIGNVLSIKTSGGWAGFCHMESPSPLAVGAQVHYGDHIGDEGNTGSASRGAHLHATFSQSGANPGTAAVIDPLPWIRSAIAGQKKPATPKRKNYDMPVMQKQKVKRPTTGPNAAVSAGEEYTVIALYDEGAHFQTFSNLARAATDPATALFNLVLGGFGALEVPYNAAYWNFRANGPVGQRLPFFDAAGNPLSSSGGGGDLSAVLAAIAAGEAQDVAAQAQLLNAIGGVDEATLATFGLKRA